MHDPGLVSSVMLAVELVAILASVFSLRVDANLSTCKNYAGACLLYVWHVYTVSMIVASGLLLCVLMLQAGAQYITLVVRKANRIRQTTRASQVYHHRRPG